MGFVAFPAENSAAGNVFFAVSGRGPERPCRSLPAPEEIGKRKKNKHFQITFPFLFSSLYEPYFYFADKIARIFCLEYPVFYAYHTKNRNTGNHHSHFHFAVFTSSYIPEYPALDAERLLSYLAQVADIAQKFEIRISHLQSQEELACLSLAMIF